MCGVGHPLYSGVLITAKHDPHRVHVHFNAEDVCADQTILQLQRRQEEVTVLFVPLGVRVADADYSSIVEVG